MKKVFKLQASNKTPERQADSIKHEVKKYISRERRKKLPESIDFWDFDCKIGDTDKSAVGIHLSKINEMISKFLTEEKDSFYLEILVKPGYRSAKSDD